MEGGITSLKVTVMGDCEKSGCPYLDPAVFVRPIEMLAIKLVSRTAVTRQPLVGPYSIPATSLLFLVIRRTAASSVRTDPIM